MPRDNQQQLAEHSQNYIKALRYYLLKPNNNTKRRLLIQAERLQQVIGASDAEIQVNRYISKMLAESDYTKMGISKAKFARLRRLYIDFMQQTSRYGSSQIIEATFTHFNDNGHLKVALTLEPKQNVINDSITRLEIHGDQLLGRGEVKAAREVYQHVSAIQNTTNAHFQLKDQERAEHYHRSFKPATNQELTWAMNSSELKRNRGVKPLLLNVGAAIASLGVFYPLVLGIKKMVNPQGPWFFTSRTKAMAKVNAVAEAIEAAGAVDQPAVPKTAAGVA